MIFENGIILLFELDIFRYKNFSATPSTTPSKDYLAMGSLLAQTPLRKSDGTVDDEDYYSDDEIVYCGEESLDLVNIFFLIWCAMQPVLSAPSNFRTWVWEKLKNFTIPFCKQAEKLAKLLAGEQAEVQAELQAEVQEVDEERGAMEEGEERAKEQADEQADERAKEEDKKQADERAKEADDEQVEQQAEEQAGLFFASPLPLPMDSCSSPKPINSVFCLNFFHQALLTLTLLTISTSLNECFIG